MSSFAPARLSLSDLHDSTSSFALDPLSLLQLITIFIAVCLTILVGVSFSTGFGWALY